MQRQGVSARRRRVALGSGFVLLALGDEWLGHTAVWYLTGGATPGRALSGGTHTYLGPVGMILAGLAVLASWLVWVGLRRMAGVARSMRAALRRAWRSDPHPHASTVASQAAHAAPEDIEITPMRLWAALVGVQLLIYLVQENIEAWIAGYGVLGLHVLTAHHGSAVVIHGAIALLAAALAVEVTDRWSSTSRAVVHAANLYGALTARRSTEAVPRGLRPVAAASPLARLGWAFLPRPPPLATIS